LVVGILWWVSALRKSMARSPQHAPRCSPVPLLVIGGLLLWLLPTVYVQARCRHDTQRLEELLEQSRLGEARLLAQRLLELSPSLSFHERPLPQVAAEIEATVEQLDSLVAQPLAADAGEAERIERARQFAILGRNEAALDLLSAPPTFAGLPPPATCEARSSKHLDTGNPLAKLTAWQRRLGTSKLAAHRNRRVWSRPSRGSPTVNESSVVTLKRKPRTCLG